MAQYIDKDTVVAELRRRIKSINNDVKIGAIESLTVSKTLNSLISFLDTLEVKENNLLTPEEIRKICTIYENLKQERECATVLYNSDETFFNHVLMEYKSITQKGE